MTLQTFCGAERVKKIFFETNIFGDPLEIEGVIVSELICVTAYTVAYLTYVPHTYFRLAMSFIF